MSEAVLVGVGAAVALGAAVLVGYVIGEVAGWDAAIETVRRLPPAVTRTDSTSQDSSMISRT